MRSRIQRFVQNGKKFFGKNFLHQVLILFLNILAQKFLKQTGKSGMSFAECFTFLRLDGDDIYCLSIKVQDAVF